MRTAVFALCWSCFLFAAEPQTPVTGENVAVSLTATVHVGKDEVREMVSSDLGNFIAVVSLTVKPFTNEPFQISADDFMLRSDKDGQRSQPFAPSQIAGQGALVVSTKGSGGGLMANNNGPMWGGMPGTGGRPQRIGGDGSQLGNGPETTTESKIDTTTPHKEPELLSVLKKKQLRTGKIAEPVSGLLYFSLEGKHKHKNLELVYTGAGGKIVLQFK